MSPLRGMPITELACRQTRVADLSPLWDMPLKTLSCDFVPVRDAEIIRSLKNLQTINGQPAAEFWKEVEASR